MTGAFTALDLPGARARVRPEAEAWIRTVLTEGGTLFEEAARSPERIRLQGRGPAYAIPAPPGGPGASSRDGPDSSPRGRPTSSRWLVRHYRRGGAVASLLGDRYLRLGTPRPFRELAASEAVRARGVATPRVVAATVHPAGLFYRGDLVTEFVEGARDLAEILFFPQAAPGAEAGEHEQDDGDGRAHPARAADTPPGPGEAPVSRTRALAAAGTLVAELGRAGIHHRDLNAKNVLLAGEGEAVRALALDLDRCRLADPGAEVPAGKMLERLLRSLEKFEAATGHRLRAGEREALVGAVRGEAGP